MEEFEWGAFAFGLILGAVVTACAISKGIRNGFKSLFVGVWNRLTKKGGGKIALVALPYWLEWRLVVILFVGAFLFVVWKDNDGSLGIIPQSFYEFFRKLYNMIFRRIEDEDAYNENAEQRKADEEYKKSLKKKKEEQEDSQNEY